MNEKTKASKLKKPSGGVVGTVIIIAVMIVVFGLVFAWMYSVDLLFLPDFVKDLFGLSEDGEPVAWKPGELQSLIKMGKDAEGRTVTYDITYENLRDAFLSEDMPEGEYVSATVTYYSGDTPASRKVCYYRNGADFRSELYGFGEDAGLETVIIGNGKAVSTVSVQKGEYRTLPAADGIGFENESGIPSLTELIERVGEFPDALPSRPETGESSDEEQTQSDSEEPAETQEITDCEIKLLTTDRGNVYYVSFKYSEPELTEEYYLSLGNRMIIFMQTSKDGKPIYTYEAERIAHDAETYTDASLYDPSKAAKK